MVDITHKSSTLRTAVAQATLTTSSLETIKAIREHTVPKGNVLEIARAAGLFGVKKTPEMIPDCHILPIEYASVEYELSDMEVTISFTVRTIYKTGVEVEAMHAVSVVALTMYDMLKPIDKGIEINNIKLLKKTGGKSDPKNKFKGSANAVVIACSDAVASGKKEDKAGKIVCAKLEGMGISLDTYKVLPDDLAALQSEIKSHHEKGVRLIIVVGGTGLTKTDITPEAIEPLLNRRIPGMEEAIRSFGQDRTPKSMLSRSICGEMNGTLLMGIPGSSNGANESMDAVFPGALQVLKLIKKN